MPVLPVVMGEEELGIGGLVLGGCFLFSFSFICRSILREIGSWRREEGLPAAVCAICLVGRCGLVVADSVAYTDACCESGEYGDDES